jgi:hypothetical protein
MRSQDLCAIAYEAATCEAFYREHIAAVEGAAADVRMQS